MIKINLVPNKPPRWAEEWQKMKRFVNWFMNGLGRMPQDFMRTRAWAKACTARARAQAYAQKQNAKATRKLIEAEASMMRSAGRALMLKAFFQGVRDNLNAWYERRHRRRKERRTKWQGRRQKLANAFRAAGRKLNARFHKFASTQPVKVARILVAVALVAFYLGIAAHWNLLALISPLIAIWGIVWARRFSDTPRIKGWRPVPVPRLSLLWGGTCLILLIGG